MCQNSHFNDSPGYNSANTNKFPSPLLNCVEFARPVDWVGIVAEDVEYRACIHREKTVKFLENRLYAFKNGT